MTFKLTQEWLLFNRNHLMDKYLLMDSFSGHNTASVLKMMTDDINLKGYSIIPPGTTSQLQPLDVGINKPFKDRLRMKWNKWMESTHLTLKRNYKSVPVSLLLQWVKQAWDEISLMTILNSFSKALPAV